MKPFGHFWLLLVFLLTLPSAAVADATLNQLERALSLVKAKEYQSAIDRTFPLFDQLKLDTVEQIILAHKVLGVSNCELGAQTKAEEHFRALLTFSPTETIDDVVATKPCANLYARMQSLELGTPPPVAKNKVATEPRPKEEPTVDKTVTETSPFLQEGAWKRYVPFGVGQFVNDQPGKGMAFLATQGISAITAGVMYGLYRSERNAQGTFDHPDRANAYRAIFWSSVGVGTVAAVWGIIDAVMVHKLDQRRQSALRFTPTVKGFQISLLF